MIELESPMPWSECLERLKMALDGDWATTEPVAGRVKDRSFSVFRPGRPKIVQIRLDGTLEAIQGGHTRVKVEVASSHRTVGVVFAVCWLGSVLLMAIASALGQAGGLMATGNEGLGPGYLPPMALFLVGAGVLGMGDWLAGRERDGLVEFVRSTFRAQAVKRPEA
jgi:hypothetical protein